MDRAESCSEDARLWGGATRNNDRNKKRGGPSYQILEVGLGKGEKNDGLEGSGL